MDWYYKGFYSARGEVFDIGNTTRYAIEKLKEGIPPTLSGSNQESSNGNGSLMRVLPLAFYLINQPINKRYQITQKVSSITHQHNHSIIACFYYLEFARLLIKGNKDKFIIYKQLQKKIPFFLNSIDIKDRDIDIFKRLLQQDIGNITIKDIKSDGYVLHTLEASIWCLLNSNSYQGTILKAVNLGEDTDTTASISGGLAGLLYGYKNIPPHWIKTLARKDYIEKLSKKIVILLFTP